MLFPPLEPLPKPLPPLPLPPLPEFPTISPLFLIAITAGNVGVGMGVPAWGKEQLIETSVMIRISIQIGFLVFIISLLFSYVD
jgi:hypothetical protein